MKKGIIVALILFAGATYVYYVLGGFEAISPIMKERKSVDLAGKEFKGFYNSDEIGEIFFQVRTAITDSVLMPPLTVVSYDPDTSSNKIVHYFIGGRIGGQSNFDDFDSRTFPGGKSVMVRISRHNLVMPRPETIIEILEDYASDEGMQPLNYTIEEYLAERDLRVYLPVSD